MPDGLTRYHNSRQSHFVTFTCYHRLLQLNTGELRDVVVEALEHARTGYRLRVYGFVVMPEHVHWLLSEPKLATLAQAIQSLKISKISSAKRTAASRGVRRPVMAEALLRNIRDPDEFLEKLDHIHENSVRRNLCVRPEDWRWSSCRHHATGEDCGVEIESEWTARKRELKSV